MMKKILLVVLCILFVNNKLSAQFTQYTTTTTQQPVHIRYDRHEEGRIYAVNMRSYPQVFASEDYGNTWRLLFTFTDPQLPEGFITKAYFDEHFQVENGFVCVNVINSGTSYTDGVYTINSMTGEVKHFPAPNANKGAWVESYDFYDHDPNVMVIHTSFKPDMFTVATEVYYTSDGGTTWSMIYDYSDHDYVHLNTARISPDNPQKLFIARGLGPSGVNGGFYVSEDAGATWTQSLNGQALSPIAINPYNSNEIMTGTFMYANSEALYRSHDGGYTWEEIPVEWDWYILNNLWDIQYDPNDANKIIVIEENQIIITRDGFNTHESIEVALGSSYDAPIRVSINPFNGEEVYIDIDGRHVTHSTNSGVTRSRVYASPTSYNCSSISVGRVSSTSYLYYILDDKCYRDNLSLSESVNVNANGCDRVIADPLLGNRAFLINSTANRIYYLDENNVMYQIPGMMTGVRKITADPDNGLIYWIGMSNSVVKVDLSNLTNITVTPVNAPSVGYITGIHIIPGSPREIYVAQGNNVYKSTNEGSSWIMKSTGLGTAIIEDMSANPLNSSELILAAGDRIYRSTNKAESWASLLSGYYAKRVTFSPSTSGLLVAGVYSTTNSFVDIVYSSNNGESWSSAGSKALHYCHTQSMDFYFGEGGYISTYIASTDMGRVRYRMAHDCSEAAVTFYPYEEKFENGGMPLCWTQDMITGYTSWQVASKTEGSPGTTPDNSQHKLRFFQSAGQSTTKLITKRFDLTSVENPKLSFWHVQAASGTNGLRVYYKNAQSGAWTELAAYTGAASAWTERTILLPEKSSDYWIAFEAMAESTIDIQIDNVSVKRSVITPCNPPRNATIMISNTYGCRAELSWFAPEGNYNAQYNIYRDNVLIAANVNQAFYTDDTFGEGTHTWTIKAICDDSESEGISLTGACSNECLPPQNVTFESTNAVHGSAIITISWELPDGYHKALYNVYRDNQLIALEISETSFIDDDVNDGEHTWSVAAICNGVESDWVSESFVCVNKCAPVRNLNVSYDVPNTKVNLNWETPGDLPMGWYSYSSEPVNGINDQSEYPYQYAVAVRWSPEDLQAMGLDGAQLTEVAYVPWTTNASYYPGVWVGGNGTSTGMQVFNQYVQGINVKPGEWNTAALSQPHIIDATQELWIGYRVTYTGDVTVGCDAGPQVAGKGNLIRIGNTWKQLTDVNPSYTYNLCIGGHIIAPGGKSIEINRSNRPNLTGYNVYRDGVLLTTTTATSYSESGLPEDTYNYCVTAIYDNGCESEMECKDFFAGNPCFTPESITATVSSEWPACAVTLGWDAVAPLYVPTVILSESFENGIPSSWTTLDKDGDGRFWRSSDEEFFYYYPQLYQGACAVSEKIYMDEDWITYDLNPDNWLITPAISLTQGNAVLKYHISQLYGFSWDTYYEVLISTSGTDYDDFTVIHSETLLRTEDIHLWFGRSIDLSDYSGAVYIAFRHKNGGEDQVIGIQLDEVSVMEQVPQARLYNVYRDGVKIASSVTGTAFIDDNFSLGEHEWSVTAICNEYSYESNHVYATASCDRPRHIITASAGANGAIAPNGAVEVLHTDNKTFIITPHTGYAIDQVLVDGINTPEAVNNGSYTFMNVIAPHTIDATFKTAEYTITATAGAGGSITPAGVIGVSYGDTRTFFITTNPGYRILQVMIDGVNNPEAVANKMYAFENIAANHTIAVTFLQYGYPVTATASAGGVIDPAGVTIVNHGESQFYTFTPAAGFKLARVMVDGVNNPAAVAAGMYLFSNVTSSHTIDVYFELKTYTINSIANEGGTITPAGVTEVTHGGSQNYSFAADTGYSIAQVLVDGVNNEDAVVAKSYTFNDITANHTIRIVFEAYKYEIEATASEGGSISSAGITMVSHGSAKTYLFRPDNKYKISQVLIDGVNNAEAVNSGSYTFTNVTAPHTIHAEFEAVAYTITAGVEGEGGIISPEGEVMVAEGIFQQFIITPVEGYRTARVLVDGEDKPSAVYNGSYTFGNVTADHTITASFEKITYIIMASVNGNGTISPEGDVTVEHGSNQTFTMTPEEGYKVADVIVDGGSVGALETYSFYTVTEGHTIVAVFERLLGMEETELPQLAVYPNPTKGELRIKREGAGIKEVQVFDMAGRLLQIVELVDNTEAFIDLTGFSNGVYFIKVDGKVVRIVKQ